MTRDDLFSFPFLIYFLLKINFKIAVLFGKRPYVEEALTKADMCL